MNKRISSGVQSSGVLQDSYESIFCVVDLRAITAPQNIEKMYLGKGYADFKNGLTRTISDFLQPLQKRLTGLSDEKVLETLREGAEKSAPLGKAKNKENQKEQRDCRINYEQY